MLAARDIGVADEVGQGFAVPIGDGLDDGVDRGDVGDGRGDGWGMSLLVVVGGSMKPRTRGDWPKPMDWSPTRSSSGLR